MSEEQPSFRLVTDNSAFIRRPGEAPAEVVPEPTETTASDGAPAGIHLAKPAGEETAKAPPTAQTGPPRECGGCAKTWAETMMAHLSRREDGKGEKIWVCPVCQQNGGYMETGTEKVRVRGQNLDTTKLFIGFALVLIIVASLLFWKFHSDTADQKIEWITEKWVSKPVAEWPMMGAQWEARVEGLPQPIRAPAILLEKRNGSVVAVAFTSPAWLQATGIKERKFKELQPRLKSSVLKVPGKPDLLLGDFLSPGSSTQETAWVLSCSAPREQLPTEPLKVRRQNFAIGLLGTFVRTVGGRQTTVGARMIQGVTGGDEFIALTDQPVTPEGVDGALFIDEFGHVVAIGAELVEGTASRAGQRVIVRWALSLKGAEK